MNLIDILTTGGIGSAIGAIAGIGEKVVLGRLEAAAKANERDHIYRMQQLQQEHEMRQAEHELLGQMEKTAGEVWVESFKHDASTGQTSQWVNNIRALVRPASLVICFPLAYFEPMTFAGFLGLMLSWYFASRGRITPTS